jgi:dihydrofolate reductase
LARLIYASNMSLDGCTEDAQGAFDWAPPDDDVFAATTDLMRAEGTYLYGRRMYETMAVWETDPALAARSDLTREFAEAWQAASKVVYSTTLAEVSTADTRLERDFDPGAVRDLKATADRDLLVGGPHLAATAFRAGLVDECRLFVWPVLLGGRNPALPTDVRLDLELLDEHRFGNGVVHLRYRVR